MFDLYDKNVIIAIDDDDGASDGNDDVDYVKDGDDDGCDDDDGNENDDGGDYEVYFFLCIRNCQLVTWQHCNIQVVKTLKELI